MCHIAHNILKYPDLHHSAQECGKTLKMMLNLIILYFPDVKNKRDFLKNLFGVAAWCKTITKGLFPSKNKHNVAPLSESTIVTIQFSTKLLLYSHMLMPYFFFPSI